MHFSYFIAFANRTCHIQEHCIVRDFEGCQGNSWPIIDQYFLSPSILRSPQPIGKFRSATRDKDSGINSSDRNHHLEIIDFCWNNSKKLRLRLLTMRKLHYLNIKAWRLVSNMPLWDNYSSCANKLTIIHSIIHSQA